MGYVTVLENLEFDKSQHGWQLRVHIASEAIDKNNNQLDLIKRCLSEVFEQDQVQIKIYEIAEARDHQEYDGTKSLMGKDRSQVGKEICIYMPDAIQRQLTSDEYKEKLLTLWKLLQKNAVPLLHFNMHGDQSIFIGSSNIPSPFSFTSQNPKRDEWKNKHGILFKEFLAHGHHPILDVHFSIGVIVNSGVWPKFYQAAFLSDCSTTCTPSSNLTLLTTSVNRLKPLIFIHRF